MFSTKTIEINDIRITKGRKKAMKTLKIATVSMLVVLALFVSFSANAADLPLQGIHVIVIPSSDWALHDEAEGRLRALGATVTTVKIEEISLEGLEGMDADVVLIGATAADEIVQLGREEDIQDYFKRGGNVIIEQPNPTDPTKYTFTYPVTVDSPYYVSCLGFTDIPDHAILWGIDQSHYVGQGDKIGNFSVEWTVIIYGNDGKPSVLAADKGTAGQGRTVFHTGFTLSYYDACGGMWDDMLVNLVLWTAGYLSDDMDGDGYDSSVDCDDNDASVNPDALEIPGDGKDNNCDGYSSVDVRNYEGKCGKYKKRVKTFADDLFRAGVITKEKKLAIIANAEDCI